MQVRPAVGGLLAAARAAPPAGAEARGLCQTLGQAGAQRAPSIPEAFT